MHHFSKLSNRSIDDTADNNESEFLFGFKVIELMQLHWCIPTYVDEEDQSFLGEEAYSLCFFIASELKPPSHKWHRLHSVAIKGDTHITSKRLQIICVPCSVTKSVVTQ
jgi:hypothetical protein